MTNNPIANVPRELKPCPFCGGEPNLTTADYVHDDLTPMPVVECKSCSAWVQADDWNTRAPSPADHCEDVRAMVAAPSPDGVDGLETICVTQGGCNVSWTATKVLSPAGTALCRLSDAKAIIDGLRGEVAILTGQVICCGVSATNSDPLLTSRGAYAEKWNSQQAQSVRELRAERDQQAQRIGELEGLLRSCLPALSDGGCAALANRLNAALSAGKEGK